jgi:alpha-D-xyloside xylohydrolase
MACPVGYYKARNRSVYFPAQTAWYDLYTGEMIIDAANGPLGQRTLATNGTQECSMVRSSSAGLQGKNGQSASRRLVVEAPYEQIPVYVRAGAIIPFGPEMEWSDEKPAELIHLYVYAGQDGSFQLYEDEGTNYNYEKGKYATIDITYDDATRTVSFGARKGQFAGMLKNRQFNIVLISKEHPQPLNLDNPSGKLVSYNGKAITVKL